MSGIAIIIDGNVGTSPLGRVTFVESNRKKAARYVDSYCNAIGSREKENELLQMFITIIENGLDEKLIALYPMLGDTVNTQKINAMSVGENDLFLGANASVEDEVLTFSNTIGIGDVSENIVSLSETSNFSMVTVAQRIAGNNASTLFDFYSELNTGGSIYGRTQLSDGSMSFYIRNKNAEGDYTHILNELTEIICIEMVQNGNDQTGHINGVAYTSSTSAISIATINNVLGMSALRVKDTVAGATISQNMYLWNGTAYFHAIGNLSSEENLLLKEIVATFLYDAKGIVVA